MAENSLESIPKYLDQSLLPQHAKEAEAQLKSIENQPGFSVNLLHIIASTNLAPSIRLAGVLFSRTSLKENGLMKKVNICCQSQISIMLNLKFWIL